MPGSDDCGLPAHVDLRHEWSVQAIAGGSATGVAQLSGSGNVQWSGQVTGGAVRTMALSASGTALYVGGDFTKIDGTTRLRLGAVAAATGALDAGFAPGTANLPVNDMVLRSGGAVLIAGEFTKVNGVTRNRIAEVDGVTGALGSLNVSVGPVHPADAGERAAEVPAAVPVGRDGADHPDDVRESWLKALGCDVDYAGGTARHRPDRGEVPPENDRVTHLRDAADFSVDGVDRGIAGAFRDNAAGRVRVCNC